MIKLAPSKFYTSTAVVIMTVFMCLGVISSTASHESFMRSDKSKVSCESTCLSHTQSNTTQNILEREEKNEFEPKPATVVTLTVPKLDLMYLVPVLYFFGAALILKKFLLTTHLRF